MILTFAFIEITSLYGIIAFFDDLFATIQYNKVGLHNPHPYSLPLYYGGGDEVAWIYLLRTVRYSALFLHLFV